MTTWRNRLAVLRAECPAANSVDSANSPPSVPALRPIGTIGAIGIGVDHEKRPGWERPAPLPLAADAMGEHGAPLPVTDHQRHLAELRTSDMQRPPSWADQAMRPAPGSWCGCCRGRRWWAARRPSLDGTGIGPGWCCQTCHPPPPGAAAMAVQT